MSAPYRWVITVDHIADETRPEGTNCNAKGMTGPRDASEDVTDNEESFRLYDDDRELYYTGKIFGDYTGFEPLDDFGAPNAGCTQMQLGVHWL